MGLNVGQSRLTSGELMHWTSGVYKESLTFIVMILSEMLTFIISPISHHSHLLSSLVVFLSGHLARMDVNADASQVILEPASESWRRPPGRPCTTWMKTIQGDLSSVDLELHEARDHCHQCHVASE